MIERSDLVVQIVDARNPLLFRTEDLEKYVLELDPDKRNLLLVNKADLMTLEQRQRWADWFDQQGIRFAFYSARLAKEAMENQNAEEQLKEDETVEDSSDEGGEGFAEETDELSIDDRSDEESSSNVHSTLEEDADKQNQLDQDENSRTRILTVHELQSLFLRESPPAKGDSPQHNTDK